MREKSVQSKKKATFANPSFETAIDEYLDTVIGLEKEQYQSHLEPFDVYAKKIEQQVRDTFHSFEKSYSHGYQVLIDELKKEANKRETPSDWLLLFEVDAKKLALFDDPEALMNALEKETPIYQLLGFSVKALGEFYKAGRHLMEAKQFEKGRDAFYFLVTIAPQVYRFWLCLGHCYTELKEYDTALETLLHTIDIDPTKIDGYLSAIHLFVQTQDFDHANDLCAAGLRFSLQQIFHF